MLGEITCCGDLSSEVIAAGDGGELLNNSIGLRCPAWQQVGRCSGAGLPW